MCCMESWQCILGPKLSALASQAMVKLNCLSKVTNVMAWLLKCLFKMDRSQIQEPLQGTNIKDASLALFAVSMEHTIAALNAGNLNSLRCYVSKGILYFRERTTKKSLLQILGVKGLPVLARNTRLAELIMWEANCENHRASSSDILARSRQRAWIIRGRYLACQECKKYPGCK